jgi:hypothetical protein
MTCLRTEMRALAREGLFSHARGPGARVRRGSVSLLAVGVGYDWRRERSGGLMTLRPLRRLRQGTGAVSAARFGCAAGPFKRQVIRRPPARSHVSCQPPLASSKREAQPLRRNGRVRGSQKSGGNPLMLALSTVERALNRTRRPRS